MLLALRRCPKVYTLSSRLSAYSYLDVFLSMSKRLHTFEPPLCLFLPRCVPIDVQTFTHFRVASLLILTSMCSDRCPKVYTLSSRLSAYSYLDVFRSMSKSLHTFEPPLCLFLPRCVPIDVQTFTHFRAASLLILTSMCSGLVR
jgi:hypothetical protein